MLKKKTYKQHYCGQSKKKSGLEARTYLRRFHYFFKMMLITIQNFRRCASFQWVWTLPLYCIKNIHSVSTSQKKLDRITNLLRISCFKNSVIILNLALFIYKKTITGISILLFGIQHKCFANQARLIR